MTPLDAVAAAIRERLLAGRPAPLPGLGTLVRQHVSARVEERSDGSRLLLPPGETIGLGPAAGDQESLAEAFGRLQGLGADQAPRAYADAMDQVEALLAATGEVRLPGVGLLRRTSGGVVLGVEADLLAAVNRTYEGLTPVRTVPPPETSSLAEAPTASGAEGPSEPPADGGAAEAPDRDVHAREVSEDSPIRELSPDPGSPFEPPAGDRGPADDESSTGDDAQPAPSDVGELDEEPERPEVPPGESSVDGEPEADETEPTAEAPAPATGGPDVGAMADEPLGADSPTADGPDQAAPADPLYASPSEFTLVPDLGPASADGPADPGPSPADVSFVDDDTLDADLDDVLAVPFGGSGSMSEVLAPTPDDRAPGPDAPASAPTLDHDWAGTTWTPLDAPPSLGDEPEIEDAEVVSDSPVPPHRPADGGDAPAGDGPREPYPREETLAVEDAPQDPAPAVGPSGEMAALLDGTDDSRQGDLGATDERAPGESAAAGPFVDDPPALPSDGGAPGNDLLFPDVPVTVEEPPAPAPAPQRPFPWWLVAVALLLATALLVAWLWPRLTASRDARPVTTVERAAPAAPAFVDAEPGGAAETDSLVSPGPPGGGAAVQANGGGQPAASGGAAPGLADLAAPDLRALSGPEPVRADADAWTLVVLSTPSRETVDAMHETYQRAGYRATVLASDRGARTLYRLAVGQFDSLDDAERLRDRLPPDAPPDTWVLDLRTL